MKIGDLVVHIGATPRGYRARLVVDFGEKSHFEQGLGLNRVASRAIIIFVDGRYDWKDQWRVFDGWENYESR